MLFFVDFMFYYYFCQQNNYSPMNTTETTLQEYESPEVWIIPVKVENAVCDSPQPGGNEDVGYDGQW